MVEAYFDWTGSCRFNWLDGVNLKLRSSWSSNSLTQFGRYNKRIEQRQRQEPILELGVRAIQSKNSIYTSVSSYPCRRRRFNPRLFPYCYHRAISIS